MLGKNLKRILITVLLSLLLYIGANYGLSKIRQFNNPTSPVVISQIKNNIVKVKVLHKEVITSKFNTLQRIQVIQTTVTQEITIKQGMESGLFKNNKLIKFTGIGKYILDLNKIHEENIIIDDDNKIVRIFTTKPTVEVELLEEKTQFQDDKGKLSFWDIKLTPEEAEKIRYEVKQQMKLKLENIEYDSIFKEKAKESLEGILNKITDNKYEIIINFVE